MNELRKKINGKADGSVNRQVRDYRAKSVDYLADKRAREEAEPPENQLKKILGDADETQLSTHELRFRKSFEKLQIPDWYLNSEHFASSKRESERFRQSPSSTPNSPSLAAAKWFRNGDRYSKRGSSPRNEIKAQTPIIVAKFSEPPKYVISSTTPTTLSCDAKDEFTSKDSHSQVHPYVTTSSDNVKLQTKVNVDVQVEKKYGDLYIPKGFFEKFKWELEEARTNRINLRQNQPTFNSAFTKNLPSSTLNALSSNSKSVTKEYSLVQHETVANRSDECLAKSYQSECSGFNSIVVAENMSSSVMEEKQIEIGIPSFTSIASIVVEVGDVLNGRYSSNSSEIKSETISLKEVFDNFFELSKITPAVPFFQYDPSEIPSDDWNNNGSGICTANPAIMATCTKAPEMAGTLLKKKFLWLKCETCKQSHRITGNRDTSVSCLHCYTYYCNRLCRKRDWKRHAQKCDYAKVNSVCRKILSQSRKSVESTQLIFGVAQLGHERRGRGCVNFVFRNYYSAKIFSENESSVPAVENLYYQTLSELTQSKSDFVKKCVDYDVENEFLLNVCVVVDIDYVGLTPQSERRSGDTPAQEDTENQMNSREETKSMQRAKSLPYRKKQKQQSIDAQFLKSVLKSLENIAPGPASFDDAEPRRKSSTPISPTSFDRKNVYRHTVGISGRKYYRQSDGCFSPVVCNSGFKFPVVETDL